MRKLIFLLACSIGMQFHMHAQSYFNSDTVKRIVFLGNSITYQGHYIELIDTYFSIAYPHDNFEFINVGLPSETVSGLSELNHANGNFPRPDLHERLKRVLKLLKPDVVFACYGMNDGIYLPFDEKRFKKFKEGINWLHREVEKSGAEILHITPAVYDERKGKAYANVLDMYSDWLLSKQFTHGWQVIDIHWPMKKQLEISREIDATFVFAKDGIHPNEKGHFLMARQILLYLGETALEKRKDINSFLTLHHHGMEILKLVQKRQRMTKDSWLTYIGHKRPNMTEGLTLEELQTKSKAIEQQIQLLLKKE
ncbi:SGNH/GDSL hydrolase family protein [Aestuariivivens sediminicola]|uniref:SGNH/GDSL hydrolase family protein n=1 Tax=Aestuariivivens sediminicola TaxID=2913560 RepID=UPI001F59CC08|nr:SGNH/GDSL hydrolase family protein [Aestuariivivens sediminicola]